MLDMRALTAAAVTVFGIAGAEAADSDFSRGYSATGYRSAQIVLYDYQPGVVVREYWRAPWRHQHYYPRTGQKPKIGRAENLLAARSRAETPKTFQRSWSTPWAFLPEPREQGLVPPPLRGK